ncbi:hypothetical protein BDN72DRAFT_760850 [Pluteus cervinus]|uniref:Uncharacterized protein n=1 Tax=Pluteus cervinus TaxID=181527 RepID=A0ACD3B8F3_9AGAR|nr:hypothetical protein BDN72DRAFT_760850 [Pluteus cervinus]
MITVHTKHVSPSDPSLPPLAIQVIELVGSYMVWIGEADGAAKEVWKASLQGNLCKDWACAMPSRDTHSPALATSFFRSASSDVAFSMAQRMAKRFDKQIFLSVDVAVSLDGGAKVLLEAEKGAVEMISSLG